VLLEWLPAPLRAAGTLEGIYVGVPVLLHPPHLGERLLNRTQILLPDATPGIFDTLAILSWNAAAVAGGVSAFASMFGSVISFPSSHQEQ
jgi:hypothetical protein